MYSSLDVVNLNAAELAANNPEEFTKLRRTGFGASDSGIILGVSPYNDINQLVLQKNSPELTEDEIRVSGLPQVRMGADCEPIILKKFEQWSGLHTEKPGAMYRLKDYPQLTINFDGLTQVDRVPVECKLISVYAKKYWDFNRAVQSVDEKFCQKYGSANSVKDKIITQAEYCGIPPYYYTQVQQQLLGTPAEHAFLAAIDVKTWQLHVFRIEEDEDIQAALIAKSFEAAEHCPNIFKHLEEGYGL